MMTQITQSGAHLQLYEDGYQEVIFHYAIDGETAEYATMQDQSVQCRFNKDLFAKVHLFNMALQPTYASLNIKTSSEEIVNAIPPNDIYLYQRYFGSPLPKNAAQISSERTRYDDNINIHSSGYQLTYDAMNPAQNDAMDIGAKLYEAGITCINAEEDWVAYTPTSFDLIAMLAVNFSNHRVLPPANSERRR